MLNKTSTFLSSTAKYLVFDEFWTFFQCYYLQFIYQKLLFAQIIY